VAGSRDGSADGSGTRHEKRDDLLADDHRACSPPSGPASIEQPAPYDPERERALTIVYTALWQLHDLDPEGESSEFQAARLKARCELDAIDDAAEASRRPAPCQASGLER
jgi:hypothetical protein